MARETMHQVLIILAIASALWLWDVFTGGKP